jgi:hypothetical protein
VADVERFAAWPRIAKCPPFARFSGIIAWRMLRFVVCLNAASELHEPFPFA